MNFDLKIALRDSKTATRPYVIVNPILAKHLPSKPSFSLGIFLKLGKKIASETIGEKVLVIGFAETATAVGAAVASVIDEAVYVHTTRDLNGALQTDLVTDFLEEHSHAKNQSLFLQEEYRNLFQFDRIIFVEDEITTGKTILNFLKNIKYSGKIIVAALVFNGFNERLISNYDASFFSLKKIGYVYHIEIDGLADTRMGVNMDLYNKKCLEIARNIVDAVESEDLYNKTVLVLGTEEFMYPALILGREIEKVAKKVHSQSTTRSPILPQNKTGYPIHSRYEFGSVYDSERKTYLYNLETYETIIVVTNSTNLECEEMIQVLQNCGNPNIYFVRVCNVKK